MTRRKRNKSRKQYAGGAPAPVQGAGVAQSSAVPKRSRAAVIAVLLIVACGLGGSFASEFFTKPGAAKSTVASVVEGDGVRGPQGMVWVPGGEFLMGSDHKLAQPNERPTHRVKVGGFWMDRTHVTNAQFRRFVEATGYVTTAERKPNWETLKVQLPSGTPPPPDAALVPGAMVFAGTDRPVPLDDWSRWWRFVPGANWKQPDGPGSGIAGRNDHPVVQVSYEDVLAYGKWAGKRLPSEAEWEFAARGGLEQATYAWGEEFQPGGKPMANTWNASDRRFPVVSAKAGGAIGTTPVGTFPANGYGIHEMTGNAWQWVADWYRSDEFRRQAGNGLLVDPRGPDGSYDAEDASAPASAPKRVTRGGSFLCSVDYCLSYRPSARRGNDPHNPMSHIGFRLVMNAEDWKQSNAKHAGRSN